MHLWSTALLTLLLTPVAGASELIYIQSPAHYSASSSASPGIREQCPNLQARLAEHVLNQLRDSPFWPSPSPMAARPVLTIL